MEPAVARESRARRVPAALGRGGRADSSAAEQGTARPARSLARSLARTSALQRSTWPAQAPLLRRYNRLRPQPWCWSERERRRGHVAGPRHVTPAARALRGPAWVLLQAPGWRRAAWRRVARARSRRRRDLRLSGEQEHEGCSPGWRRTVFFLPPRPFQAAVYQNTCSSAPPRPAPPCPASPRKDWTPRPSRR